MCGIFAYIGPRDDAATVVLAGLKRLEYRGYDSWGIASAAQDAIRVIRGVGRIGGVDASALADSQIDPSRVAVGHTRWATHGGVTERNAHPHGSCDGRVSVIHNGIVENAEELKQELLAAGHQMGSDTDTEVIAHLVETALVAHAFPEAVRLAFGRLRGRNAIVVLDASGQVVVAKSGSPIVLGLGGDPDAPEVYVSSDMPALLSHTTRILWLGDYQMAVLDAGIVVSAIETGERLAHEFEHVEWEPARAERGEHPHFMIKEILEQREAVQRAINQPPVLLDEVAAVMRIAQEVCFVGCGTAGVVGRIGAYLFADIAGRATSAILGSEFKNYRHSLHERTLLIAISQSGETADLLEAVDVALARGSRVVAVVNVPGSMLTRKAHYTLLVNAGPEKAVASTKATLGQVAILGLLAHACAGQSAHGHGLLTHIASHMDALTAPDYLARIRALADRLRDARDLYMIGRGINFPVAQEAAIKVQEVSYIHAEGLAGGELKHYAIALIGPGTPCVILAANDDARAEILGNAAQVKARGGYLIGVGPSNSDLFDEYIPVPDGGGLSPLLTLIPMQILAYYLALARGFDPDMPRNLAKSVTVK
ncbi:MAG TPA: glutamine--fructose-6-phosphate transaminase (isomerizing) [Chloroflexota bacterium]|nr:glutamine--fructose-6-phosphate transaminase (isomerizing) [Chloroflexota bacterium]